MSKYDSVSKLLNEVWMNGFQEDTYGSCQEEGFAAALILTDPDIDDLQGIIIEDDQGFIDYEVFNGIGEAQERWKEMVNEHEPVSRQLLLDTPPQPTRRRGNYGRQRNDYSNHENV